MHGQQIEVALFSTIKMMTVGAGYPGGIFNKWSLAKRANEMHGNIRTQRKTAKDARGGF